MEKKISIIIPIYNAEDTIAETVESVLNQTFQDYELILIDDESTDSSLKICKEYEKKDERICVIEKKKGGVSDARNTGLEIAKGEYITFVDADDLIDKEYLSCLYGASKYDYVVSGLVRRKINRAGVKIRDIYPQILKAEGEKYFQMPDAFFVNGHIHSCCGKLYKTSIIKKNSINFPHVRVSEDTFFNLKYIQNINSWIIKDEYIYIYICRDTEKSATSKFYPNDINVYLSLHEYMLNMKIRKKVVQKTIYAQYMGVCMRIVKDKQLSEKEKEVYLKNVLRKKRVKSTIFFNSDNMGTWLTGVIICFGNIRVIDKWISR